MGLAGMIGEMMMRCDVDLSPHAPTTLAAIRGREPTQRRALAQLLTAVENKAAAPALLDELRAAAAAVKTPVDRHHRHRRRRQVEPHRRADPAPAPRPGRPRCRSR